MFQRLANSWELAKASARVLRADKELLIFPLVSAIAALIVAATFLVPSFKAGLIQQAVGEGQSRSVAGYIVLFLFYLCQYLVTFYFNTALVGAALMRLLGGDPTARDGFRIANSHFANILGYAAVAATVGMVLNLIIERGGRAGRVVGQIGGLGWSLATFLVVPVLVTEGLGPIEAVRRSTQLLKRTWGEQIAGTIGIGAVFFLAFVVAIVLGVIAIVAAASTEIAALTAAVAVLFVLTLVALGLIQGALSGIYTAALYRHAMGEDAARFFPPELLAGAFRRV
jgi:hypothetical protein